MARIDDYKAACKIAREELAVVPYDDIISQSGFAGAEFDGAGSEGAGDNGFRVPFLDRVYRVQYPDFSFLDDSGSEKEIPLQEQVLILHYLRGCRDLKKTGNKWIAYREISGASFYFAAFVKRAIDPLKQVFGQNIDGFIRASDRLGGKAIEPGDAGREFSVFPHVPVQLILYAGDDEFPPEATILFNNDIGTILLPEDVAWLAGMVVYRLMALARA
jgi:hypothetical protein